MNRLVVLVGVAQPAKEQVDAGYYLLVGALVPMAAALLLGRRPDDLGWRWPNRYVLPYFALSVVVALPFLVWMVRSPTIAGPYFTQLKRLGFAAFVGFYLVNMFVEHSLLHGVVLGLARRNLCWPPRPPVASAGQGLNRPLRRLGLAMPAAGHSVSRPVSWLGLGSGCVLPIIISALLFGLVHLGKDARELVLSFPGGLVQAFIAYRSNSWFTPFLIHLATAGAALGMMVWMK